MKFNLTYTLFAAFMFLWVLVSWFNDEEISHFLNGH